MKTNTHFYHILFISSYNNKCFRQKLLRKSKHIFVFSTPFFYENRAIYEIMWKNIVDWGRPQMPIWHMRIACCIHKATNTNSNT